MNEDALAASLDAEAACRLGSYPAAVVVALAALAHGGDAGIAAALPRIRGRRPVALHPAADDRGPLAPLAQLLALAGTRPVPVGHADACPEPLLRSALQDAAVLVLAGTDRASRALHLHLARKAGVATLTCCADNADAVAALDAGAVLVCLNGHGGGVIAGERARVDACRAHLPYLGRLAPVHNARG